jgi:hypothetical protein
VSVPNACLVAQQRLQSDLYIAVDIHRANCFGRPPFRSRETEGTFPGAKVEKALRIHGAHLVNQEVTNLVFCVVAAEFIRCVRPVRSNTEQVAHYCRSKIKFSSAYTAVACARQT